MATFRRGLPIIAIASSFVLTLGWIGFLGYGLFELLGLAF